MIRVRRSVLIFTLLAVLVPLSTAQEKKGKPVKKTDRYEMLYKVKKWEKKHKKGDVFDITVAALRGQTSTDVYLSVDSDDPVKYPVPEEFEKLEIRAMNSSGKFTWVRNLRDVPIVNGEAIVSLENLFPLMKFEVQGHLKVHHKRTDIVRGSATVLFRPDLIVKAVQAPPNAGPGALFDIAAVIEETKLQSGSSAVVTLAEGATVIATVPDVAVPAGGQATILFQGISFPDPGTHDLTITISNSVPDEYDTGNNSYSFSIQILSPVQPATYYLSYYLYRNEVSTFTNTYCGDGYTYTISGDFGSWSYQAEIPFVLEAPIDSIRWEALSGTGSLSHSFIQAWEPQTSDPSFDAYNLYVDDLDGSSYYMNLYVYKNFGYSVFDVLKIVSDYFYVYNYTDSSTTYFERHNDQIKLQDFLEVRFLLSDNGQKWGGSANIEVTPFVADSSTFDNSYFDGTCDYVYFGSTRYEFSQNSGSGTTDPALLPSSSKKDRLPSIAVELVPKSTDLMQNYPNPFNPSTNIQFTVEHSGTAVLKVYDMLGKEVANLFEGEATEGRTYQFTFQAANFSSGMYYAKLEVGGKQFVKKMLLMK